ncbi:MAG: hydrogenase maturation nickel metallochaperone HypA [Thermodesulfobacteriota bacterium]
MHELSIALSILETVGRICREEGHGAVEAVRVRVGKAAGVHPEALAFAFEVARTDTVARAASLIIDEVPVTGRCRACGQEIEADDVLALQCPACGAFSYDLLSGRELELVDMEVVA